MKCNLRPAFSLSISDANYLLPPLLFAMECLPRARALLFAVFWFLIASNLRGKCFTTILLFEKSMQIFSPFKSLCGVSLLLILEMSAKRRFFLADTTTDCETTPSEHNLEDPSLNEAPEELVSILSKMEQLNRANECDSRSIASKRSGGESSSGSNPSQVVRQECDEDVDLWTVWSNLVKSWESEMKKRPNCVKVSSFD
jgi:hypothetical protein